jgi:hypothetical protein
MSVNKRKVAATSAGRTRRAGKAKPASPKKRAVPAAGASNGVLVEAGAKALGLAVDPAWMRSVTFNLDLILQHAARIEEFPLSDEAEPAPVFRA